MKFRSLTNLLLGININRACVKASVVDSATGRCVACAQQPAGGLEVISPQAGWAETEPEQWWDCTKQAVLQLHNTDAYNPANIEAIGIAYPAQTLVLVDAAQRALRTAIFSTDSRAAATGESIFAHSSLPVQRVSAANGLAWVMKQQPLLYSQVYKWITAGDFMAMKLTGTIGTTLSALSEAGFWDFGTEGVSLDAMNHFDFESSIVPDVNPVFGHHGRLTKEVAKELFLNRQVCVTYKAGNHANKAFALNVLQPGEAAVTAGTTGMIYALAKDHFAHPLGRLTAVAHVNHSAVEKRLGVLLTGSGGHELYAWLNRLCGEGSSYDELDRAAATAPPGSEGLMVLPVGNNSESGFEFSFSEARILGLRPALHGKGHLARTVLEGAAFAFGNGFDAMRQSGLCPAVVHAAEGGLFSSSVFTETLASVTGMAVKLFAGDGSVAAALGAGVGAGIYREIADAFRGLPLLKKIEPASDAAYGTAYDRWKTALENQGNATSA